MIWLEFRAGCIVKFSCHYYLISMEFGNLMEFIYFSSIAISVNFHDQLVIVICNPVLKG